MFPFGRKEEFQLCCSIYTDIVASFDHYQQKVTTSMLDGRGVSGKVNNFGLDLSAEIGEKFALTKDFCVEPQVKLAYYWIKGKDFKNAEGNTKGQLFVKGGIKQQFAGK